MTKAWVAKFIELYHTMPTKDQFVEYLLKNTNLRHDSLNDYALIVMAFHHLYLGPTEHTQLRFREGKTKVPGMREFATQYAIENDIASPSPCQ